MSGMLYGIGTGPGDPDLLTVKATNILQQLEIIYAPAGRKEGDSLALSITRAYLPDHIEIKTHHFPMTHDLDEKSTVWDNVAQSIQLDVLAGKKVGFISLGDIMLYSTWVSLLERLQGTIPIIMIPGITSFAYIAAKTGRPLAMAQQSLTVLSCTAPLEVLDAAFQSQSSFVLMKVSRNLAMVRALLKKYHLLEHAILVTNGALSSEKIVQHLQDIDETETLPYFSTILVNSKWRF